METDSITFSNPSLYRPDTLSIPKLIFQCTSDRNFIVDKTTPGWTYKIFTHVQQRKFIRKIFPKKLALYDKYKYFQQKTDLFVYLFLYTHGGVYISENYKLNKSLEFILANSSTSDIFFVLDKDRYVNTDFIISKPFCNFWLDVVDELEKRKDLNYYTRQEEINKKTGKYILSKYLQSTTHKCEILSNSLINVNCCSEKLDSVIIRTKYPKGTEDFMSYILYKTDTTDDILYFCVVIFVLIILLFILAIIKL